MAILNQGKVRGKMVVPKSAKEEEVRQKAMAHTSSQEWLKNKQIQKMVVVPGRVVNIVLAG